MSDISRRALLAGASAVATSLALPFPVWAAEATSAPGDAAAEKLLADIAERLLAEYPENATALGIDKDGRAALHGRLTDRSAAADRARAAWASETLKTLQAVDRGALSAPQALNVDVTEEAFRTAIEGWRFPFGDVGTLSGQNSFRNTPYSVTPLGGAYVDIPTFLDTQHAVETAADADAYLARVEAYAGELAAEAERLDHDRGVGMVAPDFVLDIMLGQMVPARAEPIAQWGLVESLRQRAAKARLPERYAKEVEALCATKVAPALDKQIAALKAQRAVAVAEPGVWQRPQGEEYYAWALKAGTTTTRTAEEMHAQGREQIAQIQAEMDTLLKAQGLSQGTVGERMTALSKRPDLLFTNDDAGRAKLLEYLNGRIADIRTRLPRAFATLVKGNLVIRRVPPAIQDGAPNGYASAGSIDGSVPGYYYINLKDTGIWPRYSLPTLCYHEGIPGHIWQGEYANQLPLIRTHLAFNAYSEGWALYAEQLGNELGAYDGDPLGKLGFLQSIGFRACRLVVDTGIHAKRWGFQQALDWFHANTGMPVAQLRSELNRYCAMPGQACGYKMGHNQINMLRKKAEGALGQRFDLKRFDDALVLSGNVPLTLLERIVDQHIAAMKG
ncbi:uncharacterized protein (DUF885 family) [Nitrospirillum amazonense]|uniref:Uncharacterized protein (DUF885 family) n=1 Tax=Nitrospirillum amazonense TaxID=28077 RepID=A0A560K946_9PROT|nr:DUF885 family protein [Nitrospirillum amazonense]TWB79787.1 uncharacterized protein (DUF885 family) [Nitrospirillum amazonense]